MRVWAFTVIFFLLSLSLGGSAEQCGWQAGGSGGKGCQSQGDGGGGSDGYLSDIISPSQFEEMLPYRNDPRCHAVGFYTYDAFISAAKEFPEFGNTGSKETRKREIAAFFGQTSHETTGGPGWNPPGGPFAWGYCYKREINCGTYCQPSNIYPCAPGKSYCGRGPIQLSWNYNYGQCGDALNLNLLQEPELVENDPIISFKAAIWFWMTKQSPKPSCHDVVTGNWTPTKEDVAAGRVPGYGVLTNIINGGIECGKGPEGDVTNANIDRIGFYERYCKLYGIDPGDNLDCFYQRPFGNGLLKLKDAM